MFYTFEFLYRSTDYENIVALECLSYQTAYLVQYHRYVQYSSSLPLLYVPRFC